MPAVRRNGASAERRQVMPSLSDVLDAVEEYLDERADADCTGDPLEYRPNETMRLLAELRDARREGER